MKIALIGYGKMGKEIERIALQRRHEIVSIIDLHNQEDFHSPAFKSADVAIEFTTPEAAYFNYLKAFSANLKVVSGSTGWIKQHGQEIKKLCTSAGKTLFWSSNFSLGIAIFSAINEYLAQIMNQFPMYDVSMAETHHIHKLDAPSGTALTLAETILENIDRKSGWTKEEFHKTPEELSIRSIREGEVPGTHSICYESDADNITITHQAKNRAGFALGAVLAAEYTYHHQGLLGMQDLFKFKKTEKDEKSNS